MRLGKLLTKGSAHALTERIMSLKETNVCVPNMLPSGTVNIVQDVPQGWTLIWTWEFATFVRKDLQEAIK